MQNKVAESSATLPTACVLTTILWFLPQATYSLEYLKGWVICGITTYIIIETSAKQALLRVRSRIISSLFLLLMAVSVFLHPFSTSSICQLCLIISISYVLRTYEHPKPEVHTLHTYLFIALGSLFWAPMLLLSPVILWNQGIFLRSLSWKGLGAALIGLLTPYFLWATVLTGLSIFSFFSEPCSEAALFSSAAFAPLLQHATAVIAPFYEPFDWQWNMESHRIETAAFGFTLLLSLTGFFHYLRKSYDDKIRVRMCHYTFLTLQVILLVWMVVQPAHFMDLYPLWLLCVAPAAGHFIALSRTWLSNAWFIILSILLITLGLLPSFT